MNPIIKRMLSLMVFVALFFAVFMGGVEWKTFHNVGRSTKNVQHEH